MCVYLLLLFRHAICNCKGADGPLDFLRGCLSTPARLKLLQSCFDGWTGNAYCGEDCGKYL